MQRHENGPVSASLPEGSPSPSDVLIRPALPADAEAIAAIWRVGWRDAHLGHVPETLVAARTPESFARRSRERIADTIVATRGDEVVGFTMTHGDGAGHVRSTFPSSASPHQCG